MAIIVSKNSQPAQRLDKTSFPAEADLQKYITANPDVVPVYEIEEDAKLFIASREFPTRGAEKIDALGFDAKGNVYVIETKLFKNPDKRTVVAQALDYGAWLWQRSNGDDFIKQLNTKTEKEFQKPFKEKFEDFFGNDDASDVIETIKENISKGTIKFVVLMDTINEGLKDLITYVNRNSQFDIYAVELEYYKHDEFEIIIPKLYGETGKKDVVSREPARSGQSVSITEDEFYKLIGENSDNAKLCRKVAKKFEEADFTIEGGNQGKANATLYIKSHQYGENPIAVIYLYFLTNLIKWEVRLSHFDNLELDKDKLLLRFRDVFPDINDTSEPRCAISPLLDENKLNALVAIYKDIVERRIKQNKQS
jgi:hypothetical protein